MKFQESVVLSNTNTVQFAAAGQSRSDLRSSTTSAYLLQRLKTNFGERAFSHAGPSAWNALPTHIRDVPNSDTLRQEAQLVLG